MARDPDAMETATTDDHPVADPTVPDPGHIAGPSRAELAQPAARRTQPLWPWLVIVVLVAIAGLIYALAS